MNRLLFLLPVAVFVVVGIGLAVGLTRDPSVLPSALIDKEVPAFYLPALEDWDKPGLASADLEDGVALVNVFASWCVPCRVEHPVLMRLAADGIPIYGINYKDRPEDARAWLAELGDPFRRIGADRQGRAGIEWGVYGVPETFVIGPGGRIRHKFVGPIQPRDVERTLLPLLAELQQ